MYTLVFIQAKWTIRLTTKHRGEGVFNSEKGCFGRNTKFFWKSADFARIRETKSNKFEILGILRYFGYLSQKFWTILKILHMVLLKQH